ncbi:MAG: AbrB/MazE/SpoVT family DNA-binding domain-containing protein [Candidatus Woesearchaeota archaeon]
MKQKQTKDCGKKENSEEEGTGMKCICGRIAKHTKNLRLNGTTIEGWKCSCGEEYYEPEQAERIFLLNKLQKHGFHLRLSQVRSNLILRIPKQVSDALKLSKGDEVEFRLGPLNQMVIEAKAKP